MEKSTKIAYLVSADTSSISSHLQALIAELDRQKYTPIVICTPDSSFAAEVATLGVKVLSCDISATFNPLKDFSSVQQLRKILLKEKPDFLHMFGPRAGLVGRMAVSKKKRPRTVVSIDDFLLGENDGKQSFAAKLERYLEVKTDQYLAFSPTLGMELIESVGVNPELVTIVYPSIDFPPAEITLHEDTRIGTIAHLVPKHGVEYFIRAASLIMARFPTTVFFIAGEGPERPVLSSLVNSLDIREGVYFLGKQDDIPDYLSTLDIFVYPSTRDALGLIVADALAMHVPVVATRVGAVPEIIEDGVTGYLVKERSPQQIADKVCDMLAEREKARAMADAGAAAVRHRFTKARMAAETQSIYESLLLRRRKVRGR